MAEDFVRNVVFEQLTKELESDPATMSEHDKALLGKVAAVVANWTVAAGLVPQRWPADDFNGGISWSYYWTSRDNANALARISMGGWA